MLYLLLRLVSDASIAGGFAFADKFVQLVSTGISTVVVLAILVTGAACVLGVNVQHPEQFLDAHQWLDACSACLRSL
jgi:hypothetical protein